MKKHAPIIIALVLIAGLAMATAASGEEAQHLQPIYVLSYEDQAIPVWSFEVEGQTYVYVDGNLTQVCACACTNRGASVPATATPLEEAQNGPAPSATPATIVDTPLPTVTPHATLVAELTRTPDLDDDSDEEEDEGDDEEDDEGDEEDDEDESGGHRHRRGNGK